MSEDPRPGWVWVLDDRDIIKAIICPYCSFDIYAKVNARGEIFHPSQEPFVCPSCNKRVERTDGITGEVLPWRWE